MKMPKMVTTIKQARALPMAPEPYVYVVDECGHTVRHRIPEKFYPTPIGGNQILFFLNERGESMQVIYGENGPMQRPCLL